MTTRSRALLALAAALLLGADDPAAEARAKLLGTWTASSGERAGRRLPESAVAGLTFVFEEGRYLVRQAGETIEEGTYTLDPARSPHRAIDLKITRGEEGVGETQPGLYQLDGDTLRFAFALPGAARRPERFATTGEGSAAFLMTFRRKPAH